ncbi:hypothetical protein TWF694_003386 [Orbilia ellipsospora]|uniref:Pre-mRNA-processing factor 39 n=1 Tax=Orbilia ellipsospora TaxID=2528407 RepID=A0AAV9WXY7_9PEZI
MHQYARYWERFRSMAQTRPLTELLPADMLNQFRQEVINEPQQPIQAGHQQLKMERGELEIEREVRSRIDGIHLEIFQRTQTETTKRWTYEQEIKRPYFHVTELDEPQLINWRRYLDFEEVEGDYGRTQFLYERCLVTAAFYDEFWFRYARWMSAQEGKEEEVRNIYQRACMLYVPMSRPQIRMQYAIFEEMHGKPDLGKDILNSILMVLPGYVEAIVALANMTRRNDGLDAAIKVFSDILENQSTDPYTKGAVTAEWARMVWKIKGDVEEARQLFHKNHQWCLDSRYFWINWLQLEMDQPTTPETEAAQLLKIRHVHTDIRRRARLPVSTIKDLTHLYMKYLQERGGKEAMKEYLTLDKEVNGPFSVQTVNKTKLAEDGKEATTNKRMLSENGHPGVEVDDAAIRKGENPYTRYFREQGETPAPNGQQVGV